MRKSFICKGAAVVIAALMVLSVGSASAQTQGMERRDERRDDRRARGGARATKQDCKAGDEKTRAECRQVKRTTKQQGRRDGGKENTAPPTNPAQ